MTCQPVFLCADFTTCVLHSASPQLWSDLWEAACMRTQLRGKMWPVPYDLQSPCAKDLPLRIASQACPMFGNLQVKLWLRSRTHAPASVHRELHLPAWRRCERRCSRVKACGKHPCKRRCCDRCPPCEHQCSAKLRCGNHKCPVRLSQKQNCCPSVTTYAVPRSLQLTLLIMLTMLIVQAPCHAGACGLCPLRSRLVLSIDFRRENVAFGPAAVAMTIAQTRSGQGQVRMWRHELPASMRE